MSRIPLQTRLISIVEPACNAAGYDLVELRFLLEQNGWTLRVCIDLPLDPARDRSEVPEDRVDLHDCEEMSRELSAVLDVEDPITQAYTLEVSSPGIDRALRTPGHFTHFAGSDAKIQLAVPMVVPGAADRRNFRGILRGVDGDAGHEHVTIEVDGQPFRLAIADIDVARLIPDWDAVMRGKTGAGGPAGKPGKGAKPGKDAKDAKDAKPGKGAKPGKSTSAAAESSPSHAGASQRGGDQTRE
jgi:ribosome maturation factor RimP